MHSLRARSLQIRALRNLRSVDLEPGPRFNVIAGDNGQGKTSLLEALYLVATTRSFRTAKLAELCPTSDPLATTSVRAVLDDGIVAREQSIGLQGGRRTARMDGQRPRTLAEYAAKTPVVVFSPSELGLSMGPGADRRKLLDRVSLYLGTGALEHAEAYARALRERQRALESRGVHASDLVDWEQLVVRHGSALARSRVETAARLGEAAIEAFARIAAAELSARTTYVQTAPIDPDAYLSALARSRPRDLARGSASIGPHRDDLLVELSGAPARRVASQGQHRAIVLALKIAEIEVVAAARGARPILLLDDVSSELDRDRTAALFRLLGEQRGQVFLTTTRPDLLGDAWLANEDVSHRADFVIEGGVPRRVG